jgi:hypothetical protein
LYSQYPSNIRAHFRFCCPCATVHLAIQFSYGNHGHFVVGQMSAWSEFAGYKSLLLIKTVRGRLPFPFLLPVKPIPCSASVMSFPFCLSHSLLPANPISIPTCIPRLAKIKLKKHKCGPQWDSNLRPLKQMCSYLPLHHMYVYVNICYSKNIYYISPEAYLLLLHNV